MSAETLRAAALMRRRAEAATTGDGETLARHWFHDLTYLSRDRYEVIAETEGSFIAERLDRWTAEHIASWDPAVAHAAADLLNHHAAGSPCEGCGATVGNCVNVIRDGAVKCCPDCEHDRPVRTFARVYLGEVAP